MLLGLGTDIVDLTRLERELERDGDELARAVLSEREQRAASAGPGARPLARAFAAKEAFFKALGHGWQGGLAWREVELRDDEAGPPRLELGGAARRAADRLGVGRIHLSISSRARLCLATVVLEA